ncbi:MAG: DUF748 domain-containing protein [Desulfobacterales bacterium]|nr:DUF748 domain-containing protein [Desulfobacterales bacterium]
MKNHRIKKSFIIAFAVLAFLFLIVLIGTPYIIDMGLERWIASQGPEISQIENIDFNPFTGRFAMDNLVMETQSGRTLNISHAYLQFSWKQLFRKQLYLKELTVQGAYLLVDHLGERGLRVGGLILSELVGEESKADTPGWEVGIANFELQNARVEYNTPQLKATYFIDQYSLTGLETWNKKKAVKMTFQGRINESQIQVDAEVVPFDTVKSWKGTLILKEGSLELVSRVHGLQKYQPSGTIDLDLQLDAKLQENGVINVDAQGSVELNKLQISHGGYSINQKQIAWKGKVAGKREQDDFKLAMTADLNGSRLRISAKENDQDLLGFEEFVAAGIQINGLADIRVEQVNLQDMFLVEKQNEAEKKAEEKVPPFLKTTAVEISSIRMQKGNEISVGDIQVQDAAAYIQRDKNGVLQLTALGRGSEASITEVAAADEVAAAEKKTSLTFQLGNLQVRGKSVVSFADESLPRPFRTVFHLHELNIADLQTADAKEPSRFNIKGQVGDYSTVTFEGDVKPADKQITLDMKGTIASLDMVPFSSYSGLAIGYNVTSGQLDAEITMKIDKGMLDGVFDLRMRNLDVAQVDPDKTPEIDNQMDIPLNTALSMLRNKKDEIHLNLKLQGDIENPEFGIQDAINQALAKAMKFAAVNYLKYTLQPFGTYIAIAEIVGKAGKKMTKVKLDPITFQAAEISLDEKANQYLVKVKEVLINRPKLRIELCGKAVSKDRLALIEKLQAAKEKEEEKGEIKKEGAVEEIIVSDAILLDFAKERAEFVKESLVKQHTIDHQRIYLCLPEIDEDLNKEPYVEILLD